MVHPVVSVPESVDFLQDANRHCSSTDALEAEQSFLDRDKQSLMSMEDCRNQGCLDDSPALELLPIVY